MQNITVGRLSLTCMTIGPLNTNVYIVDDGVGCMVVDPACEVDCILQALAGRSVDCIAITHGHADHRGAAAALREATGAPVVASLIEEPYINGEKSFGDSKMPVEPCAVDRTVEDGDLLKVGTVEWRIIATPGHTPGGISLYRGPVSEYDEAPLLMAGDTLFAGTHGRVDFPEGDLYAMRDSLVCLSKLPHETMVFPGHGELTTIGRESGWLRICGV